MMGLPVILVFLLLSNCDIASNPADEEPDDYPIGTSNSPNNTTPFEGTWEDDDEHELNRWTFRDNTYE
jgi:hypothetical protein